MSPLTDVRAPRFALVIDDDPIICTLVASILKVNGFETRTAANVSAARHILRTYEPDIAVVDLDLGEGPSGIDLTLFLTRTMPETAVLLLTKYSAPELMGYRITELPATVGFILKAEVSDVDILLNAVEGAIASERHQRHRTRHPERLAQLTSTQIEVLQLMAAGYSTAEIATRRGRSQSSTEQVITRIYQQLEIPADGQINQRAEAVRIFVASVGLPQRNDGQT